jgi:hypothetical protein
MLITILRKALMLPSLGISLKVAFPAQFGIASAKDASVAINLEYFGGSNQWNVSFAREAYDWEVDGLASFF